MEGDRRALVVGSGYAGTKHADPLRELGISRFAAAARGSASRDKWVSVA